MEKALYAPVSLGKLVERVGEELFSCTDENRIEITFKVNIDQKCSVEQETPFQLEFSLVLFRKPTSSTPEEKS